MAGDKPMLSAFAARKAMLAKAIESKNSSAAENDNGGSVAAGTAQGARTSTVEAPTGASAPEKRTSGRRKRQRVEVSAAVAGAGEQKAAVVSGAKQETKGGGQSKNKRATANEPSQPPAELCGPEDLPKRSVFRLLYSAPEWNKKLADLTNAIKSAPVFICGPKGSGKSTFGRLLTNRLLTQAQNVPQRKAGSPEGGVIVLDLDPGQPEFCPAGTVSLVLVRKPNISPPFAHPWPENSATTLIRCHALASVTPGSDTDFYMECALDLYRQYQRNWNGYPLVVNTPGWILGTGLDLLGLLIGSIRPGKVVYMSEDGPTETVEGLQAACRRTSSFDTLPSQQSGPGSGKTAAQLRAMQTMSYFHSRGKGSTGLLSWDSSPLSTVPPWRVAYSGMNRGLAGIMCYGGQPGSSLLAEAINGMVLAAVEIEDEKAFRRSEPEEDSLMEVVEENDASMHVDASKGVHDSVERLIRRTPEGIPYFEQDEGNTLDPLYSRTIGLVLVRGVDVENAALQIITPIPRSTLEEIRQNGRQVVLVHGQFDAPTWAYTEDLYEKELREVGDDEDEDESGEDESGPSAPGAGVNRPWVEGVDETRRRRVGAGTWRVRRDLGKQNR
ncbi:related to Polynucleotide 5'-hydroxyl-kinase GRC3 [Cephalotrichum gorgonifer]|uniref:Polynucleotide 5'-hydroxyl-kinase GRC3 n=1 Tax=Cephalotrichum gorgonifer TaxID=2041049 RepID=A0AAE8SUQ6_9PEZI|nr:related to Polynucleotide 5'-hydroxyl-kinase GRC3 [Cephalotrichum gorgonifer]